MRAIELKHVVLSTYYRIPVEGVAVEVDDDVEFDPVTMVQRKFDYRLNIKSIMSAPKQSGQPGVTDVADIDSIRKSVAILTELKKTKEGSPLVLEDEDFNYLVSRIKETRWPFIDQGILTFIDDIEKTTAMSKERVAAAVAKIEGEDASDEVAVRPTSPIDAKRNGKAKEHARR